MHWHCTLHMLSENEEIKVLDIVEYLLAQVK